jgi:hypothetical protein
MNEWIEGIKGKRKMEWKGELDLNTKDLRDCVQAADN